MVLLEVVMSSVVFNLKNRILVLLIFSITLPLSNSPVYAGWTVVEPPHVSGNWVLNDVHFISKNEGWAVGWNVPENHEEKGLLLHYYDGSWIDVSTPNISSDWELFGVHFISSTEGWAVGFDWENYEGVLLHYLDGSWTAVTSLKVSSFWELDDVHFTSPNEGWAVGVDSENDKGLLLHYLNGTWTLIRLPYDWGLQGVHFTSPYEGWAVGWIDEDHPNSKGAGALLHYLNGSWIVIDPPDVSTYWGLSDVHFTSSNEGWAVGWDDEDYPSGKGILLHYLNGSWIAISTPKVSTNWLLNSVHLTSPSEGWAVGYDWENKAGILLRYLNGLWAVIIPPEISSSWRANAVHFTSPNEGWAVGYNDEGDQYRGVLLKFSLPETISIPSTPKGKVSGIIGKSYKYTTGDSTSNLGHTVEYQFDWSGDGSDLSAWGSATQSKPWSVAGIYDVRARARCTQDTSVLSDWSNPLTVTVSLPNISVTPTTYDFGILKVNKSKTASFQVKNKGTADLSISSSIIGPDASVFQITSGSGNKIIKPGKSLSIKIAFKPTSSGTRQATLRITSNDPDSPTIDIPLSGTGK
jgi:photosystem II stability/assembly factor-like uncharacterized protein